MEQASALGIGVISFCGGEPFVHPDFIAIARRGIQLGFKVQMTTNGSLATGDNVDKLKGLDCMTVSIDALQQTHDEIRGVQGAFQKACRTLCLAADAGIPRGTNTVIQRKNAMELLPLFHHLLELTNGRIDYVRHAPAEVVPETADLMVVPEQVPAVQKQLQDIANECDRLGIFFSHRRQMLEHLPLYLDKWTRHRPAGGCRIPQKFIGYSDLGFYLCWHQGHSIRAESLQAALESAVARKVVVEAAQGGCSGCNALTYSWDEEWNQGILEGKLVQDGTLLDQETTIHGSWAER
jgi:sulfatase maturation enzyme AslB (radical SAM superfamily)